MRHILGNKVLEYDVDDRGVIVDEREIDRTVNPKPNIDDWVKEHMVFWYDMSKPVDTYIPGVTYANSFVNLGGKITYDKNINKCIITHTPTNNNNQAFWQIIVKPLQYVESYKIRVTGLPTGFTIKGRLGYDDIQITSDGEYDIPEYRNSSTTNTSYPGFYLAGANVNDVDCNIVVEEIPTRQSVPTNEILKANPYLQDFSGNNRPLKLNNFLFAAMSGVGGYTDNFNNWNINSIKATVKLESSSSVTIQAITQEHIGVVYKYENGKRTIIKVNITGISEEIKGKFAFGYADVTGNHNIILENGYFEFDTDKYEGIVGWYGFKSIVPINICNITIEQIPSYPNALITDGVDDYGVVENFEALQNYMMFFQCAIIRPNTSKGMFSTKSINNNQGWMLCQNHGKDITRFGNNTYMNFESSTNVEDKTNYILTADGTTMVLRVGDELQPLNGTYSGTGGEMGFFISDYNHTSRFGSMAFYKSILFNAVPTKETDGFTEQDLIDYVLKNIITQ